MKKKTKIEFNTVDYDYMDKMPVEGWAWEFIRRSDRFLKSYEEIEIIFKHFNEGKIDANAFCQQLRRNTRKIDISSVVRHYEEKINDKFFLLSKRTKTYFFCFPKPHSKYIDVEKHLFIPTTKPIMLYKYETVSKYKTVAGLIDNRILEEMFRLSTGKDALLISIRTNASASDIKTVLMPAIRQYLQKNTSIRKRDKKWKYYLITYDLRKKQYGYKTIVDALFENYPEKKNLFDEKNIENYFKNALLLINGEYKKYICRFPK